MLRGGDKLSCEELFLTETWGFIRDNVNIAEMRNLFDGMLIFREASGCLS